MFPAAERSVLSAMIRLIDQGVVSSTQPVSTASDFRLMSD